MVIHYYMHLYALVIFVNVDLTSLQIPNKISSSGVQTTLSKNGLPPDIVQKINQYGPHGQSGARDAPDWRETLTTAAALI